MTDRVTFNDVETAKLHERRRKEFRKKLIVRRLKAAVRAHRDFSPQELAEIYQSCTSCSGAEAPQ